ncbi:MAG: PQQ-like beta-propeller repeat protein [Verrucomicrobia bacterium]|nr:PQQ-like beta-propeller repeat protein [Verrucomicrobiota bacterium]
MTRSLLIILLLAALPAGWARAQSDGSVRWSFTTVSSAVSGNILSSPAVAPDGTVYVGVEVGSSTSLAPSGRVFALTSAGAQRWVYQTPDWVDSTPAVAPNGTIYFGCWDGKLYALNPDGTKKWTFATSGFVASSPALATDGTIYIGSGDGSLYAVNPDGSLKWTFLTGDWIDSAPAVGPDGTIYVGSWDGNFYAIRPDGTARWRYATGGKIASSPAIAADGSVYVGSRDLNLYAFSADGTLRWSAGLGDTIESAPALGADGTIYVTTTGGRLFALAPSGDERWRYPASGQTSLSPIYSSPAVRADGSIVFGSSDNALYILNADGTLKTKATLGDWADSSALVTRDGVIYIGCTDKKLYAFNSASSLALTDWPQLHRDPQRTGWTPMGAVAGTTGRLLNLSVRTNAGTGADTLTVGFVASGTGSRTLLVRGVGPTLATYGVTGVLTDPRIAAFVNSGGSSVQLDANDNWGAATNAAQIASTANAVGAFALPDGSLDAALLRDFAAGVYSVQVAGAGGGTGVALMEVYDAGGSATARLVNVSARSAVGTGAGILIAGFVVDQQPRTILVRGVGPTLAGYGVTGVLANPRLQVFDGAGRLIAENDDWSTASNASSLAATARAVGAFDLNAGSQDAVLLLTLPPGVYSAQVAGVGGTTGVGLVEVYEIP